MALRSAHSIIQPLMNKLFEPEGRRLQTWIDQLCKKNAEIKNLVEPVGFMYSGRWYRPSHQLRPGKYPKVQLHISLWPEISNLHRDIGIVKNDKQFIGQTLAQLLARCNDLQDVRDTLPECLVPFADDWITSFARTRPEAFTIEGNERALRQYERVLPKMEVYSMSRLLF